MYAIELLAENRGDYPGYLRGEAAVQMSRVKAGMLLPLFNLKFYGERRLFLCRKTIIVASGRKHLWQVNWTSKRKSHLTEMETLEYETGDIIKTMEVLMENCKEDILALYMITVIERRSCFSHLRDRLN